MFARTLAFVVWALVAGSAVFWGARLMARPVAVPPQAALATAGPAGAADLTRLFGVPPAAPVAEAPPPPPASARFQLVGLAAPRPGAVPGQGVALIAVDGKPARAFRAGATVDGDYVLQAVQPRAVQIGPRGGPAQITLELPALPPPATGVPMAAAPGVPGMPGVPTNGAPVMPPGMPNVTVMPVNPGAMVAPPPAVMPQPVPSTPQAEGGVPLMQPGPVVMPSTRARLRGMRSGLPDGTVQTPQESPTNEAGANLR